MELFINHRKCHTEGCTTERFKNNVPVRLLGTRFTNAISSFKPGPQETFTRDIWFETP
jgi:hypothetical protein